MKPRRDTYQMIYERLTKLYKDLEKLEPGDYVKFKSEGYMDLSLDVLSKDSKQMEIALAHNYVVNGDLVPDPDMTIRIYFDLKSAEALTYQDTIGFQQVYPTPKTFYPKLKTSLNKFLNQWLINIHRQGFKVAEERIHA